MVDWHSNIRIVWVGRICDSTSPMVYSVMICELYVAVVVMVCMYVDVIVCSGMCMYVLYVYVRTVCSGMCMYVLYVVVCYSTCCM